MLGVWYGRWQEFGEAGLLDMSSRPSTSPNQTPLDVEQQIVGLRRDKKWGAQRIASSINRARGLTLSSATVQRVLVSHGISRLRDMDLPTGNTVREIRRYEHAVAGDMVHVDVKKVGKIPPGGGHAVHGRGTDKARASKRGKGRRIGYTYLHCAVDDHSRLGYIECLEDEKGTTAAAFWRRARAFFAEHGIITIHRVLTDNGSAYRSRAFNVALDEASTVHKFTKPYTPKTNGKVERFNRTLKDEWLNVRPYASEEARRAAVVAFLNEYNHEREHSSLRYAVPSSRVPLDTYRLSVEAPILLPAWEGDEQLSIYDFEPEPDEHARIEHALRTFRLILGEVQPGKSFRTIPGNFDPDRIRFIDTEAG